MRKTILVKDLETAQDFGQVYEQGKVVRVAYNKKDRLTMKKKVIYLGDKDLLKHDKTTQIKSFYSTIKDQF